MWSILQVQQPEALVRVTDVMTVLYVINVIIELHNQDIWRCIFSLSVFHIQSDAVVAPD